MYGDIFSGPERRYDDTQDTIAPKVCEKCVFPFEDGYGVHHGCRETKGVEKKGLEESNHTVKK